MVPLQMDCEWESGTLASRLPIAFDGDQAGRIAAGRLSLWPLWLML
jgi:hypothetical protein